MHILIDNVRGIAHAEFDINSIALVAGDNGAGKSSIALAVAAALSDNVAPIPGMLKGDAGLFLRDGATKGTIEVSDKNCPAVARVAWPSGKLSAEDGRPQANPIACGLFTVASLKPKDMADTLGKLLGLDPTFEELQSALPTVEPARLAAIWKVVESSGWDAAHHKAKEHGAKAKGAWEHVTQENYGSVKAGEWRAPNLGQHLDENLLIDQATEARERLQALQRSQALDADLVHRLEDQKKAGDRATADLRKLQPRQNNQASAVGALRLELRKLPQPEELTDLPACPACGTLLVVETHDLLRLPTPGMGSEENNRRRKAIEAKRAELIAAEELLNTSDAEVATLQAIMRQGASATMQLGKAPQNPTTAEELQKASDALTEAQNALIAAQAQNQADAYHSTALMMNAIADALAPTGVRQSVLLAKLGAFNKQLCTLTDLAGWEWLQVRDDLTLWYGAHPYWLCSKSEQFRAQVVLQLALSSGVVLIDGADILGKRGRNELMSLLHALQRPALVCMTLPSRADMPDLAKAGYGKSYWLESGVLQ